MKKTKNQPKQNYRKDEVLTMFEHLNGGIKLLAENQGVLSDKFDKLDGKVDSMQQDITDIKFELKRKVSYDEFEKLENRVVHLEKVAGAR